ncbi:MAG: hypothetical protein IKQ29_00820 [Bacilli bacterium]|nr:hypothetical protein [Bacilli bacterium]
MSNLILERYINNILDNNLVNNTKILYKSINSYSEILKDYKDKKMVDFMEYYINDVLDSFYNKKEYTNNSIIYLLKGLIHFLEISEILLKYEISDRDKLDKYIKSNDSSKIIKNKDVKKSKSLELILLLEMGMYNLLDYYKVYKKNINTMTDLFVGNEEEFYSSFMLEIEPQLRSLYYSLDGMKNVDKKLSKKISDRMIENIINAKKEVKNKLKELL